jgi:hypothetical protein
VLYFVGFVLLSHLFFLVEFSQWLPCSFFLPGNNSLQLLGLPPLLFSLTTCLNLTLVRPSQRQRLLRSSFTPSSALSRRSSLRQASNRKKSGALASLPKQVLQDILDTVNVCNELDQPSDLLKEVLLWQFGKSKRQSYFEVLRLPIEMKGLKPSILMGKLKQHLPHGVSPDNNLFLSMFLIRLLPSMREVQEGTRQLWPWLELQVSCGISPVAATDIPKITIIMPLGLFEYFFMPFGLS